MDVYLDAGDGMASVGEVAAWSFDLAFWGECAQGASDDIAIDRLRRRVGVNDLRVAERITGPEQVFDRDRMPATDLEVAATSMILERARVATITLIERAAVAGVLDQQDDRVEQQSWMSWRTPRAIAQHLADDASGAYLKRLGLPLRVPSGELFADLRESDRHVRDVVRTMPRNRVTRHDRGEVWTSVKVLRRLAWHERVEQVFLRRRLRAAGIEV